MTLWRSIPTDKVAYPSRFDSLKFHENALLNHPDRCMSLQHHTAIVNDHVIHSTHLLVTSAPSACAAVPVTAAVTPPSSNESDEPEKEVSSPLVPCLRTPTVTLYPALTEKVVRASCNTCPCKL
jgi:hypothetical protein